MSTVKDSDLCRPLHTEAQDSPSDGEISGKTDTYHRKIYKSCKAPHHKIVIA